MSEEKRNPMDLNGDGKVTFSETLQYAAMKAKEKVEDVCQNPERYNELARKRAEEISDWGNSLVEDVKSKAKDYSENQEAYNEKARQKAEELSKRAADGFNSLKEEVKGIFSQTDKKASDDVKPE